MIDVVRDYSVPEYRLYVNSSYSINGGVGSSTKGLNEFTLGGSIDEVEFTKGIIDDVGVFNRVPTQQELNTLYADSLTRTNPLYLRSLQ